MERGAIEAISQMLLKFMILNKTLKNVIILINKIAQKYQPIEHQRCETFELFFEQFCSFKESYFVIDGFESLL